MRIRNLVLPCLAFLLLGASSAMAQQHVVAPSALRQAVITQAATDQHNRDVVVGVLHQAKVRAIASRLGLDVTRAENAVSTLGSADLARLGAQADTVNAQLAGGDEVIIISVTTLLLIVILILLLK